MAYDGVTYELFSAFLTGNLWINCPIFLVWEGEIQPGYTITGINYDFLVKTDYHVKLIFCKTYCNLL